MLCFVLCEPPQGQSISFYKRAQILVADFWGIMEAGGEGDIPNLDTLTMFADYRVPQALVYLGVLRYSGALMDALKSGTPPPRDSGVARMIVFLAVRKAAVVCVNCWFLWSIIRLV